MKNVLIIGCGDIGRRVAKLAMAEGARVTALARSPGKAESLLQMGMETVTGDLDGAAPIAGLPTRGAVVFYFAPPPGGGVVDPRIRVFCGSVEPGEEPEKVVYLSTSGVYGDCGGEMVTEKTPVNPQTDRARRRLDAETILRGWAEARGVETVILRVDRNLRAGPAPPGSHPEGTPGPARGGGALHQPHPRRRPCPDLPGDGRKGGERGGLQRQRRPLRNDDRVL